MESENAPDDNPKAETKRTTRRRLLKRLALGAVTLIGGSVGDAYAIEPERLQVETSDVRLENCPSLRVGHLSDFHCNSDAAVARTERAARLLLTQKPEIVALTGDFVSGHSSRNWARECAAALSPLTDALPDRVFAVLGNHDWWSREPDKVARELERVGVKVLRNQSAPLPSHPKIWLVGLDSRCVKKQRPARALRGVPSDAVKILLIHEPDYADEAPSGFALQLSGHSHGGQIRVPVVPLFYLPRYGRRYVEGLSRGPHHPVYTTRGVGMIGPPVRFRCPPEVTLLQMRPEFRAPACRVNETQQKYGKNAGGGQTMATRTASELNGLAVLTINGGERLGRVEDTVVEMARGRVTGFFVDGGGLFKPARFLAASDVQSLGTDALTIKSMDMLQEAAKELPAGELRAKTLGGLPVVSEAGTALGKVADVQVNDEMHVPGFVLSTGLIDNALHGKPLLPLTDVRSVGKDSVVVSNAYDPKATANQTA